MVFWFKLQNYIHSNSSKLPIYCQSPDRPHQCHKVYLGFNLGLQTYQLVVQPLARVSQALVLVLVWANSQGLSFKKSCTEAVNRRRAFSYRNDFNTPAYLSFNKIVDESFLCVLLLRPCNLVSKSCVARRSEILPLRSVFFVNLVPFVFEVLSSL